MPSEMIDTLGQVLAAGGPGVALDHLIARYGEQRDYSRMFDARMMKTRFELGLPLQPVSPGDMPEGHRDAYNRAMIDAARDAARLYLEAGDIASAWPYFRALGEAGPVREAISRLPNESSSDAVIEIALQERVHPQRGFELLLAQYGICRAITFFDQYPDPATREDALALLVRTLHAELVDNISAHIERQEGARPAAVPIPDLIAGRDWLFGQYVYHADVSHIASVIRFATDAESPAVLERALEIAEYGRHLSPDLRMRGEAPFEDVYEDYARYLGARLGRDVDAAIAHFEQKVASYDYDQIGTYPAQMLVRMLLLLGRPEKAIEIHERFLTDSDPAYLICPPLAEVCRMAGDRERLLRLAERDNDPLAWIAARAG